LRFELLVVAVVVRVVEVRLVPKGSPGHGVVDVELVGGTDAVVVGDDRGAVAGSYVAVTSGGMKPVVGLLDFFEQPTAIARMATGNGNQRPTLDFIPRSRTLQS
jgi:hypothetical protein